MRVGMTKSTLNFRGLFAAGLGGRRWRCGPGVRVDGCAAFRSPRRGLLLAQKLAQLLSVLGVRGVPVDGFAFVHFRKR